MEIALAIARETRDRDVVSSVYMNAGWLLERAGEAGRAADLLVSEAIPIARELGLSTLAMAAWGAFYLWLAGRWDEGRRVLDEAAHDDRVRSGRSNSLQVAGALYDATMGRFDPAQAALDQLRLDDHGDPAPHVIAAELSLWRGDPTAAIVAATSALALGPLMIERGDRTFRGWVLRLIARAEADRAVGPGHRRADDDRRAAAARADAAAAQCRELVVAGDPYDRFGGDLPANLAQTEAEATRASGHSDPVAWASAADAWDQIARPFEAAYSRYRRAEALLAEHGRRAEAADDLRHAAAVATGLGAAPLLREIESLATRSRIGLDARMAPAGAASDAGAPAPALTRREMEVLALLAEGRTNRQIADALFISESTAGVHVSNILGKLAVTGRTEAAAVAYRSGLVPTGRTDPS
jgi:DNA-binding CsgD family transcriptional regulator/tetratricopeptide (TPR) repeat protein